MDRNHVIRTLQKRASDLLERAKILTDSDPSIKPQDPNEGWDDGYWGEAFTQYDDEFREVHLWLRYNAPKSFDDAISRCLTNLDYDDEHSLPPSYLDCRKYPKEAFRYRCNFIDTLKRTAQEFLAVADSLERSEVELTKKVKHQCNTETIARYLAAKTGANKGDRKARLFIDVNDMEGLHTTKERLERLAKEEVDRIVKVGGEASKYLRPTYAAKIHKKMTAKDRPATPGLVKNVCVVLKSYYYDIYTSKVTSSDE